MSDKSKAYLKIEDASNIQVSLSDDALEAFISCSNLFDVDFTPALGID